MDNIKTLATEWWRSKNSFQKTALRRKYQKGEKHDYFIHISIQDMVEMYEAEHASIGENLKDYRLSIKYEVDEQVLQEFKDAWRNNLKGASEDKIPLFKEAKSTWDKEEVRKLMRDSFNQGVMAESFSLPIDFDADKWIEEKINKTINSK